MKSNYALERSVGGLANGAAGAGENVVPAALMLAGAQVRQAVSCA